MERVIARHILKDPTSFKSQVLAWSQPFNPVVWLDSNNHNKKYSEHDAVLAIGQSSFMASNYKNGFEALKKYQSETNDYIFGYLGYDLKNDVEQLSSNNLDNLDFSDVFFFQPKKIILVKGNIATFKYLTSYKEDLKIDIENIFNQKASSEKSKGSNSNIKLRISKDTYLKKVNHILDNIHHGELYEATFCQEFYSENTSIDPIRVYENLNEISKAPFATFFKRNHHYALSASPERYLKKSGRKIISQPIKGTAKRSQDSIKDLELKIALQNDAKERAENIMIVDLVRNDLSRIAKKGTTKVKELCGTYSFKQVHQMISTISTEVRKDIHPVDIIKNTFPMGSMTGAPKIAAMEIIEKQEETKRGLYSGCIGYFSPEGDFDFNVIIRTILYNAQKKYVSFSVGSAITSLANPEKEFEECLLKANAMREVLTKYY
jgi:para-aminobenzoate synthetase component 1